MSIKLSLTCWMAPSLIALWVAPALAVAPRPMGDTQIGITYPTASGPSITAASNPFNNSFPVDYSTLQVTPTLWEFNSFNFWGRRANVAAMFPDVLGADESLITHSFYKLDPTHTEELFPGLSSGGSIEVAIESIQFDRPVDVIESTFIFHTFWDLNQVDQLHHPYEHEHNVHTLTTDFRDAEEFYAAHEFADPPHEHQVFGDLAGMIRIEGEGTNVLNIYATIPYDLFMHIHEHDNHVPPGLPAPQGFLEPYHFHLEYVVAAVPEPGMLILLTPSALFLFRRRGN